MVQGRVKIEADLFDKATPALSALIQEWLAQGTVVSQVWSKPGLYTISLDHPDFWQDKRDVQYDLIIAKRRDMHGNTKHVISVLKGLKDDGRWHVAKDYLSEAKGSVRIE